ncbi:hypothetical protein [Hydrocarboniphaga daqingensis]|uniref:hypothetical protein n=1 Tax=Hydrocarboniphaga daqingensis TaxID=490188 RepID=UPI0015872F2B|nr:hypothetical protein [Hydrocarboniphaga daqingensis]
MGIVIAVTWEGEVALRELPVPRDALRASFIDTAGVGISESPPFTCLLVTLVASWRSDVHLNRSARRVD